MSMSRTRTPRKTAATLSLLARLSVPFLAAMGGATAQGCLFGSPGPSSVAVGTLYVSGEAAYDQFFSELYQVQLPMGQATDREAQARARVANVLGVAPSSSAEQVADGLDQRAITLGKAGLTLKVQVSGLDAGGTPAVALLVTGSPPKPSDANLVSALTQSLKDDAALIADLRRSRPEFDRLKPQADSLEPGIDVTFRKGGAPKKAEVRKNLVDAQRLIPLMAQRSTDVEGLAIDFIERVRKVLGTAPVAVAPPPAAPAEPVPAPAPPRKKGTKSKPAPTEGSSAPGEAKPTKSKAAEAESEPAEPKATAPKAKPATDDFEP